jgi:extradiol dioxygenase family protein
MMQVDYGSAVFVRDLRKALAFYEMLGFSVTKEGNRPGVSWVKLLLPNDENSNDENSNDENWIALIKFEEPKQFARRIGGHTGLVLATKDLHSTCESLKNKDVQFDWEPESRPWGFPDAQILDQDNNKILLVEEDNELEILRSHRPTE